ncbi:MAG: hypothetical protein JST06_00600 [Bacteroidetes bacterium]|nr:hypothetical protein [Bacteroidota bacterium]MBS1630028.1 hypothetical protein [Bacteroidota bacterium]
MNLFANWKEKASNFIDVRLGLFKLSLIERTSKVFGQLVLTFIYAFMGLIVLAFIGIGLMELLGSLLQSRMLGAFLTAAIFLVLLLLLLAMRKSIHRSLADMFVRLLTEDDEDDEAATGPATGQEH